MSRPPRPSGRPASWLLASLLAGGIGYLAGREHLLGHVRASFESPARDTIPATDPGREIEAAKSYTQIEDLLEGMLQKKMERVGVYQRLMDAPTAGERRKIVAEARTRLLQGLQPWPGPKVEMQPRREPWFQRDGIEASRIRLTTFPGVTLEAALLAPVRVSGAHPALLALHGFDGDLESLVNDQDYHHGFAFQLARRGYVVLSPLLVSSTVENQALLGARALAKPLSIGS